MPDTVYERFLIDTQFRGKLLAEIRKLARIAALEYRGASIGVKRDGDQDHVEEIADSFARKVAADPKLSWQLHRNIRFGELADRDLVGLLTGDGTKTGIIRQRPSNVIRGAVTVSTSKVEKRKKWEDHNGYRAVEGELTKKTRQSSDLALQPKVKERIDPTTPVRNLKTQDIRAILDIPNCDGVTALEILILKVFIAKAPVMRLKHPRRPAHNTENSAQLDVFQTKIGEPN